MDALFELGVGGAVESETATLHGLPFPRDSNSLEEFAYRHGRCYDSYLALEPDRQCFWSRDRRGAVAFVRVGKYLHVGGGLLAAGGDREPLLAEFVTYADRRGLRLSFYNLPEQDLPLFRRYGFQATKWGEEALIDLRAVDWSGSEYAWVRRQASYCRRQGLRVSECVRETTPAGDWERLMGELVEVSAALIAAKPQARELRFLDGSFAPDRLARQRLFVARAAGGAGRVEGFLLCNPFRNGRSWAFELYRRRADAVRGVTAFLMHQTIERLREEEADRVSLCLAPGLRSAQPLAGDSPIVRWGLAFGSRHFSVLFDAAGLHHFKSRFRPRFENRYLCARPGVTLGSAWTLIRLLGVLDVDARKFRRRLGQRLGKSARRRWECLGEFGLRFKAQGEQDRLQGRLKIP